MKRPIWLGPPKEGWDHVRIPNQVIEDPRIGTTDLAVYAALARHANLANGETSVSQGRIAGYFNATRATIGKALKRLVRYSYVAQITAGKKIIAHRLLIPPSTTVEQLTLPLSENRATPASFLSTNKEEDLSPPTPHLSMGGVINIRDRKPKSGSRADGTNPRALRKHENAQRSEAKARWSAAFTAAYSDGKLEGPCAHGKALNDCRVDECIAVCQDIIASHLEAAP